jgi:hypothetical protein
MAAPTATPTKSRQHRPLARHYGADARSLELADSISKRQRIISEQEGPLLREIAEFNRTEAWRGDGALSMRSWLITHLHIGGARACVLVEASEHVEALPRLCAALCAGDLTLDVFAPIASVCPAQSDQEVAQAAVEWTPRQARDWAAQLRGKQDEDSARQAQDRQVHFNDAKRTIVAQLTDDAYGAVKAALVARGSRAGHVSASDDDYEPPAARYADALLEFCTGGGGKGGGKSGGVRVSTTVVVHTDLERLLNGDGYGHASLEGVGPISAEVARRLACDADVIFSFDAPDGSCLDQRALGRDPTPAQRREMARRDQGCRFPGCTWNHVTNVHHIVWASEQGPTVMSNMLTLCVAHHNRVHELGWSMDGDANATVTFTSPQGHRYSSVPSPTWRLTTPMRR